VPAASPERASRSAERVIAERSAAGSEARAETQAMQPMKAATNAEIDAKRARYMESGVFTGLSLCRFAKKDRRG
jgi:hypothetical protein